MMMMLHVYYLDHYNLNTKQGEKAVVPFYVYCEMLM
jgi:hypothetical protein